MTDDRCPRCGGLVSPDAEWCGQCYASLREAPEEQPEVRDEDLPEALREPPGEEPVEPLLRIERPPEPFTRPPEAEPPGVEIDTTPTERPAAGPSWTCPACGEENPVSADRCETCGTPFASLLREGQDRTVDPEQAWRLSWFFPGLGHIRAGLSAEGLARVVSFAWLVGAVVAVIVARRGQPLGSAWVLLAVYGLAAVALYAVTPMDAERAAAGQAPILSSRTLLIGLVVLIFVTLALPFLL